MLDDRYKKSPFTVPDNYFENLNSEIMDKLSVDETFTQNNKKKIPLWKHISRWTSVAAVISGLAFVGNYYMSDNGDDATTIDAESIPSQHIAQEISRPADIGNEYSQFLEDEATRMAYKDEFFNDDF